MEIDSILLSDVIEYNKNKYYAFSQFKEFTHNQDYERILSARYMKVSRIKKRIVYLCTRYKYIYFCTFTFDDEFITRCDRTKKDYIKNSLKYFDNDIKIILNIDYGKKTEREHYHGIIATNNSSDLLKHIRKNYKYRFNIKRVFTSGNDVKRLSKYIDKLTNHCIKESTKKSRIYYNFKGYESFCPTTNDVKLAYLYDCFLLGIR